MKREKIKIVFIDRQLKTFESYSHNKFKTISNNFKLMNEWNECVKEKINGLIKVIKEQRDEIAEIKKQMGVKTSLPKKENNIPLKELRKQTVIEIYQKNPTMSIRKITSMINEKGIKISRSGVHQILKKLKK